MRHGFKSIAGSAGDDRRRERGRERERGTRASNQDELLTTGRGGGKRDPRPSVCRPWDAFVSCKKRGVEGRSMGGGRSASTQCSRTCRAIKCSFSPSRACGFGIEFDRRRQGAEEGSGQGQAQSEVTASTLFSLFSRTLLSLAKRMKQWDLRASSCCGCNRIHQPKWDTCAPAPGHYYYCSDSFDSGLANGFWSQHLKR